MAKKRAVGNIKMGDRIRDNVTGFTGIAVSFTTYIDCGPSWGILGEALKDGKPVGTEYIDAWRVRKAPSIPSSNKK